jgi:hypothetical protein
VNHLIFGERAETIEKTSTEIPQDQTKARNRQSVAACWQIGQF